MTGPLNTALPLHFVAHLQKSATPKPPGLSLWAIAINKSVDFAGHRRHFHLYQPHTRLENYGYSILTGADGDSVKDLAILLTADSVCCSTICY